MNIILLSGGSGKRLWPLSNDIRSRQFIKIFKKGDTYESMIQRVCRQIRIADGRADITVSTSKEQVSAVHNQLGESVNICVEPERKGTFPGIALTAAYLHGCKQVAEDEIVIVCPIDPYVEDGYFVELKKLVKMVESGANVALLGIKPAEASENYGYIVPETTEEISWVKAFREKPDTSLAKKYMESGALWNGGVFAYKMAYVLNKAHEMIDFTDYEDLYKKYATLEKISFDYAVVEKEKKIQVIRFSGQWKDLGTWNTLTEAMEESMIGDARMNDTCNNVHVINELNIPILCMGLKDAVVSASPEGILVSDKEQSSYIKPYVDAIDQRVMFAEKSWGSFRILDVEDESLTIIITLNPGHKMNYHSHERRDEVWTIVSGTGTSLIDGVKKRVQAGDVLTMPAGCRHTLLADTELKVIEVQIGHEITVHDKIKYDME